MVLVFVSFHCINMDKLSLAARTTDHTFEQFDRARIRWRHGTRGSSFRHHMDAVFACQRTIRQSIRRLDLWASLLALCEVAKPSI